jgi:hypothetical protein
VGELRHTFWDDVLSYLIGASLIAEPVKKYPVKHCPRPQIRVVDPNTLTITAAEREIYRPFLDIIAEWSSFIEGLP